MYTTFEKGDVKGTVHSSNIWAKSLVDGSLIIVLLSLFYPNMPVGPVIQPCKKPGSLGAGLPAARAP